ncbi:hypothetical protein L9F63_015785, partial [Diploptera punctata]
GEPAFGDAISSSFISDSSEKTNVIDMLSGTNSGVDDTFQGPPSPQPNESPPSNNFQSQQNQHSSKMSSGATSKSDKHQRRKKPLENIPNIVIENDNRNLENCRLDISKSSAKQLDRNISRRLENPRGSCPDITISQVVSPRPKRRKHKGRYRQQNVDNPISNSPHRGLRHNASSPNLDTCNKNNSEKYKGLNTLLVPTPVRCVHSELSKSAPCDTWCFMDPIDLDTDQGNVSPYPSTSSDSPPFRIRSCTSPETMYSREEQRTSNNSWFKPLLPSFSGVVEGTSQVCSHKSFYNKIGYSVPPCHQ